ncbi:MAG: hypothetical protein SOW59_09520 [Corynebacterium sp.]|nr:hypothetical protein [Corynebacterium sp.]
MVLSVLQTAGQSKPEVVCGWCGKQLEQSGRGRPKKFCSPSCKQRAYERRVLLQDFSNNPHALTLSPEKASRLIDGLFELRCSAEDIATAASEGADSKEIEQLCAELVKIARRLEDVR